jgi:hypothetical protein
MRLNKDGTAKWEKGDIVEVNLFTEDYDPNPYYAKCLTTNVYPVIQVIDPRYPEPFQGQEIASPFIITRLLDEEEASLAVGEEGAVTGGVTYSYRLRPGGGIEVFDKRKKKQPTVEFVDDVAAAEAWIEKHECPNCGKPVLEPGKGCSGPHYGAAPEKFSF